MHKIYTCKYFTIWIKYTQVSNIILTYKVHILVRGQIYILTYYLCTGLVLGDGSLIS